MKKAHIARSPKIDRRAGEGGFRTYPSAGDRRARHASKSESVGLEI